MPPATLFLARPTAPTPSVTPTWKQPASALSRRSSVPPLRHCSPRLSSTCRCSPTTSAAGRGTRSASQRGRGFAGRAPDREGCEDPRGGGGGRSRADRHRHRSSGDPLPIRRLFGALRHRVSSPVRSLLRPERRHRQVGVECFEPSVRVRSDRGEHERISCGASRSSAANRPVEGLPCARRYRVVGAGVGSRIRPASAGAPAPSMGWPTSPSSWGPGRLGEREERQPPGRTPGGGVTASLPPRRPPLRETSPDQVAREAAWRLHQA